MYTTTSCIFFLPIFSLLCKPEFSHYHEHFMKFKYLASVVSFDNNQEQLRKRLDKVGFIIVTIWMIKNIIIITVIVVIVISHTNKLKTIYLFITKVDTA